MIRIRIRQLILPGTTALHIVKSLAARLKLTTLRCHLNRSNQYSNHEELFTPPPDAVPEFPSFPAEDDLADFTAADEIEPGNMIEDEIEDTIER